MKTIPSDITIPRELTTEEACEAYCERLCILSNGDPITEEWKEIALKEAMAIEDAQGCLF